MSNYLFGFHRSDLFRLMNDGHFTLISLNIDTLRRKSSTSILKNLKEVKKNYYMHYFDDKTAFINLDGDYNQFFQNHS